MILLKSILAGLLAVLIAAIIFPIGGVVYLTWKLPPGKQAKGYGISFDPVAAARSPVPWIIAAIVFSLAFY